MSSPTESRRPAASGVIHDIGYRPYSGPRLGEGSVAWAFFVTGLRNCFGLGRSGRSKILPMALLAVMLLPALILVGVLVQAKDLLGELERISDHVVVLDSGRLLRSSATTEFMHRTGTLLIEVQGRPDADRILGQALVDAGLRATPADGRMIEVEMLDDDTRDVVRDLTVDLGLGLVRMQERHHRIEDVFREGGAGSVQPH